MKISIKIKYLSIIVIISLLCICTTNAAYQGEWNGFKIPPGYKPVPAMESNTLPQDQVGAFSTPDTQYHLDIWNYTDDLYNTFIKEPEPNEIIKVIEIKENKYMVIISGGNSNQQQADLDDFVKENNGKIIK